MAFRSEILIKLDKKGRVLLPAAFRDELPAEDRGAFVLYHSPNLPGVVNGNSRAGFDGMLERLRVEALGQSVQADVFHLYALKEGAATASVLLNFFVVGAPASEWRLAVPPGVGNLDVTRIWERSLRKAAAAGRFVLPEAERRWLDRGYAR